MTRGGVTPPIPPGTTAVQVFADSGCTTRPVAGVIYPTLYVRLNRDFGFGDSFNWGDSTGQFTNLTVSTPTYEDPDDPYNVVLYIDWVSEDAAGEFAAGTVVAAHNGNQRPFGANAVVDFYDE